MWWRPRARSAGWRSSTTPSRPPAAPPRWCRSNCATPTASPGSPRAIDERYGRLDMLIGNAALGASNSPLDHFHPKEWDEVMAVNVTANWHLIRFFNPLLQALRRRPRGVRDLGLADQRARLSRALRGVEGGARHHGAHLRGRDRVDADQGQSVQSGPDAHPDARRRDAGRRPDDAADAGRGGGGDRAALPAGLSRRPESSTTSASRSCCRSARRT